MTLYIHKEQTQDWQLISYQKEWKYEDSGGGVTISLYSKHLSSAAMLGPPK